MNITYEQIKSFRPCYDPAEIGMDERYRDSIVNFIKDYRCKVKSIDDILWVVCRNDFMTDRELRLYAVWCARKVQHLMIDERSINALNVAEKFANGDASQEDLVAARGAAQEASWGAAQEAAWCAAWCAACCAPWGEARGAAREAAREAARGAAREAAREAARGVAQEAARGAAQEAAPCEAWCAAWEAQIDRLIEVFEEKEKQERRISLRNLRHNIN